MVFERSSNGAAPVSKFVGQQKGHSHIHKLVVAWIEIHQEDLLADWELAINGKKPFLIKGLDQ